jgi:pyruvate dehydrogenase E2 component (dihydrolipoamide acetyltransferase)
MAKEFKMPQMTATMDSGTIVQWFKKEGDLVNKGEPLVEITTDKINMEVESLDTGILKKIIAQPGDEVPVSQAIAYIGEEGDESLITSSIISGHPAEAGNPSKVQKEIGESEGEVNVKISPVARKLAREAGLDIYQLVGTGPEGRITKEDVQQVIVNKKAAPSEKNFPATVSTNGAALHVAKVVPLNGIRKTIAKRLADSFRDAPHITLLITVDMTFAQNMREGLLPIIEKKYNVRLSYTDLILKAAALALRAYPILNSSLINDEIKVFEEINIGLAVSIPDGLIVPTIAQVDKLDLSQIATKRAELVKKAQGGTLRHDEIADGTFTLTNLGTYGIDSFSAVINPPQVAILALGAVSERVTAYRGQITIRPEMTMSVSADHRVVDGALVAQFLAKTKALLETPSLLIDAEYIR